MSTHTGRFMMLVAASTSSLFGCNSATEVTIGQTPDGIDLGECFGAGTVCTRSTVEQMPLVVPELRNCQVTGPQVVTLAWRKLLEGVDFGLPTDEPNEHLAVARDGSVWIATVTDQGGVIAHYDAGGLLLGDSLTAFDPPPDVYEIRTVTLAADSTGRAYVGYGFAQPITQLGWRAEPQLLVGRYAANAQPAGELVRVQGVEGPVLKMSAGADDALLVAGPGQEKGTAIGRFEPSGSPLWIRPEIPQTDVFDLIGDGEGRTAVLGTHPGPTPTSGTGSLAMYDPRGNLLWDLHPPSSVEAVGPNRMVAGMAGDLILLGSIKVEPPPDFAFVGEVVEAVLHRIDRAGHVLWATHVAGGIAPVQTPAGNGSDRVRPTVDGAGNVFFAAQQSSIYWVSADGISCSWFQLAPEFQGSQIIEIDAAPDGTVFAVMMVSGYGYHVARLSLDGS